MNWYFERQGSMGGAGGEAFKSVFNGTGRDPAATLAREAVQNSVDAALEEDETVEVQFNFRQLTGDDKAKFFQSASLNEMVDRRDHLGLIDSNCLRQADDPLDLLYVEDYGTTGLAGDPKLPSSHLRKLLLDLGGSPKAKTTHEHTVRGRKPGGSYGFGKAAYSSTSKIGVIFAFSRTTDSNDEDISVLMGAAYQADHDYEEESFTGRAWMGVQDDASETGPVFHPFTGNEAERIAKSLGFDREDGYGTSVLIIDCPVEPEKLIEGLEDYWWPRIDAGLLNASVSDQGDEKVPRPKKRKHLQPFIQAYSVALDKSPEESRERKQVPFRQKTIHDPDERKVSIGKLGLVAINEDEDDYPLGEKYDDLVNTIALVRSPMMVVKYETTGRSRGAFANLVGCFVADEDIDGILRLSEPPPHDEWDPTAERLPIASECYPEVVRSVNQRIKRSFKEFQRDASPPDPYDQRRLTAVERTLAQWFGASRPNNPTPPPNPSPISLNVDGPRLRLTGNNELVAEGELMIKFAQKALESDLAQIPIEFRLSLKVKEDEGVSSKDPVPFDMEFLKGDMDLIEDNSGQQVWRGILLRGESIKAHFISSPYSRTWTIKMVPEVEEYEASDADRMTT